jgi:hypothetical protein
MFIAALFTIAKRRKQPKCPSTDEWIRKIWCTTPTEIVSRPGRWLTPVILSTQQAEIRRITV